MKFTVLGDNIEGQHINGREKNDERRQMVRNAGTELSQFNLVNILVADALAPCVTRSSAAMILTLYAR